MIAICSNAGARKKSKTRLNSAKMKKSSAKLLGQLNPRKAATQVTQMLMRNETCIGQQGDYNGMI